MPRFFCLLQLLAVASLLSSAACGGKPTTLTGTAGAGAGGQGGTSGSGGAPITTCPASNPRQMIACSGSFACQFDAGCTCHGCCVAFWSCVLGNFKQTDFNDICAGPRCEDGGAGPGGSGGVGGSDAGPPPAVCTPGADQTCNDNPIVSSIHGHCTDAGTCACTFDAGTNPDSGRCL